VWLQGNGVNFTGSAEKADGTLQRIASRSHFYYRSTPTGDNSDTRRKKWTKASFKVTSAALRQCESVTTPILSTTKRYVPRVRCIVVIIDSRSLSQTKTQAKLPPSASTAKAPEPSLVKTNEAAKIIAAKSPTKSFWEELECHLKNNYTAKEAATLMQHARYHHQGGFNRLNLEELNALCTEEFAS
jgi:hypothetical protein